ncbi:flavin reductase family protein [Teredinibacter purpureus]|uniref:flavin reductase family protein n=1 Tax=Teredinibacter purpureus TaxID=2731756 RepID=UPI0005F79A11|nr:flavin reductase family protein [Teredinibacter purpureus]
MTEVSGDTTTTMFDGMRRLLSGVTVITANNSKGERFAMTASSVTSVSAEPPSLLVCINRQATLDHAILETQFFCVNVLAPKHKQISINCATPEAGDSRFEHGHWQQDSKTGLFYLGDAQAVFICSKKATFEYGTHNIVVGDVTTTLIDASEVSVLGYLNGSYLEL